MKKAEDSNNTKECIKCKRPKPWNEFELCDKETGTRRNKCNECKNKKRQELRRLRASGAAGRPERAIAIWGSTLDEATAAARASEKTPLPKMRSDVVTEHVVNKDGSVTFSSATATAPTHVNTAKIKTSKDVGNVSMEDPR